MANTAGKTGAADLRGRLRDRRLVDRCVAGEVQAWEELYASCHDPLVSSIRFMLGPRGWDDNLVDEIAARVWYGLVAEDGRLLSRYEPARNARLVTYFRALARDEINRYFRSEHRRRDREMVAASSGPFEAAADSELTSSFDEFVDGLTPAERRFLVSRMLGHEGDSDPQASTEYSRTNAWQLTSRIRAKMTSFLS